MKSLKRIILLNVALLFGYSNAVMAQFVYPGDANQDSIVNHIDLLYIGKNAGFSGPGRSLVTNNFAPQTLPLAWSFNYYGSNALYSDCNGDGIINDDDTLAINLNYNLSYGAIPDSYYNDINSSLEIISNKDTISFGDTLILKFINNQSTSTYGMAYSLAYDSWFSDLISSFSYSSSNVWFNLGSFYNISNHNELKSAFEMATVRKLSNAQFGSGEVGELSIIIEEDLVGGIMVSDGYLNFDLFDVIRSDDTDLDTLGSSMSKEIYFKNPVSSTLEVGLENSKFKVYPSLINQKISVENLNKFQECNISIKNTLGVEVYSDILYPNQTIIDFSDRLKGIYFLEISDINNRSIYTKKIFKN